MFTGIVEELGTVSSLKRTGKSLKGIFIGNTVLEDTKIGDSIAINGVCQTVTELGKGSFSVDISETTLRKTTMNDLKSGDPVNLERALKFSDRIGGHLVQGHVNNTAEVEEIKRQGEMYFLSLKLPADLIRYCIDEGSVALDGISLTISELNRQNNTISIQVIPHTFENTTLKYRKKGSKINIETDMIGRYIESLTMNGGNRQNLTQSKLTQWGY